MALVAGELHMIDPQKVPYIASVGKRDKIYHIYDSTDGNARCGEKPAAFEDTMNRTWRPQLSHLIQMDGHQEIHDKIYHVVKKGPHAMEPIPLCKTCSATAQSPSPTWHEVLQLPFEKAPNGLIQSGHDVRLIQMPKGALIGWVEHKTKPKFIDRKPTVHHGMARSRYGGSWSYTNHESGFTGWTKTKMDADTMYVSIDDHEALIRELSARVKNTSRDEAVMYIYPSEDIFFMAQYTDGKYQYAGAWTFSKPSFNVKRMGFDEFISSGYWMPMSKEFADEEFKSCPGCGDICSLESVPFTTLEHHKCLICKWSSVQPQKPSLIPKE